MQSLQEVEGCREMGDARRPGNYPSRHRELLQDLLELQSSFLLLDSPSGSLSGDILDAPHWHSGSNGEEARQGEAPTGHTASHFPAAVQSHEGVSGRRDDGGFQG